MYEIEKDLMQPDVGPNPSVAKSNRHSLAYSVQPSCCVGKFIYRWPFARLPLASQIKLSLTLTRYECDAGHFAAMGGDVSTCEWPLDQINISGCFERTNWKTGWIACVFSRRFLQGMSMLVSQAKKLRYSRVTKRCDVFSLTRNFSIGLHLRRFISC